MKKIPSAMLCFALSLALAAPTLSAQKRKKQPEPQPAPAAIITSPIDSTLADLERISAATDNDIGNLKADKKGFNWKTSWMFWHKDAPHSPEAEHIAASLQRNLHDAMPGLIHDARNSPGNFTATFRLYNNLSVVCESLDSLIETTKAGGKKEGDGSLVADSAAMGRIRQDVATYVEQMASALDKGRVPLGWSRSVPTTTANNGKVKKIVIDDNVPERKSSKQ